MSHAILIILAVATRDTTYHKSLRVVNIFVPRVFSLSLTEFLNHEFCLPSQRHNAHEEYDSNIEPAV
jgi:hypothetical protein